MQIMFKSSTREDRQAQLIFMWKLEEVWEDVANQDGEIEDDP